MKLLCLMFASFSLAAAGQTNFHAFESYEQLIEGGTVHTLAVDAGREHLVIRVPRGYAATVENQTQSVLFKESTGSFSIAMRVTTNSPGALPDDGAPAHQCSGRLSRRLHSPNLQLRHRL